MEKIDTSEYSPKIQAMFADLARWQNNIIEMKEKFSLGEEIADKFKEFYCYGDFCYILKTVSLSFQFTSFKQAKAVLRFMAEKKIKRTGKVSKSEVYNYLSWPFDGFVIKGIFEKPESTCKFVKVGVKLVEQPIYEMRCDEAMDPVFEESVVEAQ